jgi:hypothetical protein
MTGAERLTILGYLIVLMIVKRNQIKVQIYIYKSESMFVGLFEICICFCCYSAALIEQWGGDFLWVGSEAVINNQLHHLLLGSGP